MMRSFTDSGGSAATQVKVVSAPKFATRTGPRDALPGSQYRDRRFRRVCRDVPGSRTAAGHPTDHVGTREVRIACMPRQAEKARTGHGDTEVGPTHSRGVAGVMPGGGRFRSVPLEGVGRRLNGVKAMEAVH
jgi:hypothetical protein